MKKRMSRTVRSLAIGLLMVGPIRAQQAANPDDADWSKIATAILHRSLQLAAGDRVIIHFLPGHEPGLVEALRRDIIRSGAMISAELSWPTKDLVDYFDALSTEQKTHLATSQNEVYREIFARSDVYVWLDESPLDDLVSRQFEHLIDESKVRAVHCHFAGAPNPESNPELWKVYLRAIEMEPTQLRGLEDSLARQIRGSTLHLTSPDGTDLRFKVLPDAGFHMNDGDASQGKLRNPRSTRDREEELPAGDLRTTGVSDANGKLVAAVNGGKNDNAVLTFERGHLVKIEPRGIQAAEFAKWFANAGGDRDRIGELVIGNNPYLVAVAAVNPDADFGYRAGTVRLDIGENWESGGDLRNSDHQQWAFIVTNGTLMAGRKMVIQAGIPIHRGSPAGSEDSRQLPQ